MFYVTYLDAKKIEPVNKKKLPSPDKDIFRSFYGPIYFAKIYNSFI